MPAVEWVTRRSVTIDNRQYPSNRVLPNDVPQHALELLSRVDRIYPRPVAESEELREVLASVQGERDELRTKLAATRKELRALKHKKKGR